MAAPTGKTPTMVDVAREARCHASTVSLALRGDPRIPEETRERVQAAAQKLGYRIHPVIAAWVSARRAGRPIARRLPAAYLVCHPEHFHWKADAHFRSIFDGAREQAERYGFALTEFRVSDYELSAAHQYPGVQENNRGIGRCAADLLVSLVLRNERGIPASRQTVLVEPLLDEAEPNRESMRAVDKVR